VPFVGKTSPPSDGEGRLTMKTALYDCLMAQSLRTLEAISRARAWPFNTHATKAGSARRLADLLPQPEAMRAAWDALPDEGRGALRHLARCSDPVPREDFIYRYGEFRPYKPWRPDAPRRPWLDPISPAERLIYAGLVFPLNLGTTKRPVLVVALPDEIRLALADLLHLPAMPPVSLPTSPLPQRRIDQQVFALLSFLNTHDVQPLWDRWLPPKMTRRLAGRLAISTGAPVRSELQVPRLVFIHYLAERAGLLDASGVSRCLKPTLLVQPWLSASTAGRLRTLWDAWLERDKGAQDLWQRYRLPTVGEDDPLTRFQGLIRALKALPPDHAILLDTFLDELTRHEPALFRPDASYRFWDTFSEYVQADYCEAVRRCLGKLLAAPLAWFGVVCLERVGDGPDAPPSVGLTPLGAALLQPDETLHGSLQDERSGEAPHGAPLHLEVVEKDEPVIAVHSSGDVPLPVLWSLEEMADAVEREAGRYVLSRGSFLRALDRGHTVEGIVGQLERDGGDALSPAVLHLLYHWAEEHGQVTLRPAMILQTRDPALLKELAAARRVRDKFTGTLSARAVTVDASAVDLLVRQLERRGIQASVERPLLMPAAQPGEVSAADRVAIVAALSLAHHLSRDVGLRMHLPYPLFRDWQSALSPVERDAAESWVSQVLARLRRRTYREEGDYRPPFPVARLIPVLEEAIARGATVEIEYHALDRPVTIRRVDPLRLEQWGRQGKDYLIAFCHLRGEERIFRLDRMARVDQVTLA